MKYQIPLPLHAVKSLIKILATTDVNSKARTVVRAVISLVEVNQDKAWGDSPLLPLPGNQHY